MPTEPRTQPDTDQPSSIPPMAALQSDMEAIGLNVSYLEQEARTLIRQRPVMAALAAAGLGYLLARLASRASR
ncbi:MAG: hypothetical protein ABR587_02305 [Candidatus Binatia bacterium]